MRRVLLAATAVCLALPVWANPPPPPPSATASGVGVGQARSSSVAGATSRSSSSLVGTVSGRQTTHVTTTSGGGASSSAGGSGGTVNVGSIGTSGAAGGGSGGRAPDVAVLGQFPSGARCPGVGLGGGGSGLVGGGGGLVTWYSTDCAAIERAEDYARWGDVEMAKALLAAHFPEDQRVRASMVVPAAAPLAPPPQARYLPEQLPPGQSSVGAICAQAGRGGVSVSRAWVARNC
jgi:hypothetical protein